MELDNAQRLADLVRRRRLAFGLSIDEAARRGGMSPTTWGRIEAGQPVRQLSYAGVDRALSWQPGGAERILAGGEPSESDAVPAEIRLSGQEVLQLARQVPVEVLREIIHEKESEESAAVETERRFDDDGMQKLWEIRELSEFERENAIQLIKALRTAAGRSDPGEESGNVSGM